MDMFQQFDKLLAQGKSEHEAARDPADSSQPQDRKSVVQ
jgi:hypothetical protein